MNSPKIKELMAKWPYHPNEKSIEILEWWENSAYLISGIIIGALLMFDLIVR